MKRPGIYLVEILVQSNTCYCDGSGEPVIPTAVVVADDPDEALDCSGLWRFPWPEGTENRITRYGKADKGITRCCICRCCNGDSCE